MPWMRTRPLDADDLLSWRRRIPLPSLLTLAAQVGVGAWFAAAVAARLGLVQGGAIALGVVLGSAGLTGMGVACARLRRERGWILEAARARFPELDRNRMLRARVEEIRAQAERAWGLWTHDRRRLGLLLRDRSGGYLLLGAPWGVRVLSHRRVHEHWTVERLGERVTDLASFGDRIALDHLVLDATDALRVPAAAVLEPHELWPELAARVARDAAGPYR
jgi:hypothetical protein